VLAAQDYAGGNKVCAWHKATAMLESARGPPVIVIKFGFHIDHEATDCRRDRFRFHQHRVDADVPIEVTATIMPLSARPPEPNINWLPVTAGGRVSRARQ
jgi:hypothetical protein